MTVTHRKIWWFEYEYEEKKCEDLYDNWVIVERVKHIVTITKTPRGVDWYKDNAELLEFIVALERSWRLDNVEIKYSNNDYGKLPKPWEQPTIMYSTDTLYDNTVLCDNNEHDAKTRTLIWKSSLPRTRFSSEDLSSQISMNKKDMNKKG